MTYESAARCALKAGDNLAVEKWLLAFVAAAPADSPVYPLPPMEVALELWKRGERGIVVKYLEAASKKEWRSGRDQVQVLLEAARKPR
jgi:hypothetical protein